MPLVARNVATCTPFVTDATGFFLGGIRAATGQRSATTRRRRCADASRRCGSASRAPRRHVEVGVARRVPEREQVVDRDAVVAAEPWRITGDSSSAEWYVPTTTTVFVVNTVRDSRLERGAEVDPSPSPADALEQEDASGVDLRNPNRRLDAQRGEFAPVQDASSCSTASVRSPTGCRGGRSGGARVDAPGIGRLGVEEVGVTCPTRTCHAFAITDRPGSSTWTRWRIAVASSPPARPAGRRSRTDIARPAARPRYRSPER